MRHALPLFSLLLLLLLQTVMSAQAATCLIPPSGPWPPCATASGGGGFSAEKITPFQSASRIPQENVVGYNDRIYFLAANNHTAPVALWVSDGSRAGTRRLGVQASSSENYAPTLTLCNDLLFYSTGTQLWVIDALGRLTKLVDKPLRFRVESSGRCIFSHFGATDGRVSLEVWHSSGMPDDTRRIDNWDSLPSDYLVPFLFGFTDLGNGNFLFVKGREDKNVETSVWIGNANGVTKFSEGSSVIGVAGNLVLIGDYLEPTTIGGNPAIHRWFAHDLNGNRQREMPQGYPTVLGTFNAQLMVTAEDKSVASQIFHWAVDGTAAGSKRLFPLGGISIEQGIEYKDRFYFGFNVAHVGRELWVTDGTLDGTHQFAQLHNGISPEPRDFSIHAGWLYFTARTPNEKRELWRTNGNSVETLPITRANQSNFTLLPSWGTPLSLVAQGEAIYFVALDSKQVAQLWRLPVEGENACTIPSSGPWPPCATGSAPPPSTDDCVIPPSGPWPACARLGEIPLRCIASRI